MSELFDKIADALATGPGYFVEDHFLTPTEVALMLIDFSALKTTFTPAKVGRETESQNGTSQHEYAELRHEIRRDSTLWFNPLDLSTSQQILWSHLEELRLALNEKLLLGLWELEGHYASYSPGGFYKRHLDRFRSDDARTISIVFYMNDEWKIGDGGALKIYTGSGSPADLNSSPNASIEINPLAGRLVCFLSDRIEHEVLESLKERKSFAGWFRRRELAPH